MVQPSVSSRPLQIPADTACPTYDDLVVAMRLAGRSMRQHPRQRDGVREAMARLTASLQAFLATQPQLVIVAQQTTLTLNDQCIATQAAQDVCTWMRAAGVASITITPDVDSQELEQLLHLIAMADNTNATLAIPPPWRHIRTTARAARQTLPTGHSTSQPNALSSLPLPTPRLTPPADFQALRDDDWAYLRTVPREGVQLVRRRLLTKLNVWLTQQGDTLAPECAEQVAWVLAEFLRHEDPGKQLPLIVTLAREQVARALRQDAWPRVVTLLRAATERLAEQPTTAIRAQLAPLPEQICSLPEYTRALLRAVQLPHSSAAVCELCQLTGGRAIAPLITRLMEAIPPAERAQILHYLRQLGEQAQPQLLAALRTPPAPEIACDLLALLGEVGTGDALPVIEGYLTRADVCLRAAALGAAIAIAGEQGSGYLFQGLRDAAPAIRRHAASLAYLCPHPPVLHAVLRLLTRPRLRHGEPDDVQLAACLALGHFKTSSARRVLIHIVHPQLWACTRRKTEQVRAAAVLALTAHYNSASAQQAIQRALKSRSEVIRAAAQQAWRDVMAKNQVIPATLAPGRS